MDVGDEKLAMLISVVVTSDEASGVTGAAGDEGVVGDTGGISCVRLGAWLLVVNDSACTANFCLANSGWHSTHPAGTSAVTYNAPTSRAVCCTYCNSTLPTPCRRSSGLTISSFQQ